MIYPCLSIATHTTGIGTKSGRSILRRRQMTVFEFLFFFYIFYDTQNVQTQFHFLNPVCAQTGCMDWQLPVPLRALHLLPRTSSHLHRPARPQRQSPLSGDSQRLSARAHTMSPFVWVCIPPGPQTGKRLRAESSRAAVFHQAGAHTAAGTGPHGGAGPGPTAELPTAHLMWSIRFSFCCGGCC